jgi:predicted house-cleaning noncanonical NTP pyrophosphatase (MazG superfamily)
MRKIITEFKKQGVFEQHRDYIRAWFTYLDQKAFSEKLEKQILGEIKRYLATRDRKILDHIIEVIWNETNTEAWIVVIKKNILPQHTTTTKLTVKNVAPPKAGV